MSYFDDQEDAWLENNCHGDPTDYNPYTHPSEAYEGDKPRGGTFTPRTRVLGPATQPSKYRSKSHKRNHMRRQAEERAKAKVLAAWDDSVCRVLRGDRAGKMWAEVFTPKLGLLGNGKSVGLAWKEAAKHSTVEGYVKP
jgi:hypothetical protein